jgi:hypothetical protein
VIPILTVPPIQWLPNCTRRIVENMRSESRLVLNNHGWTNILRNDINIVTIKNWLDYFSFSRPRSSSSPALLPFSLDCSSNSKIPFSPYLTPPQSCCKLMFKIKKKNRRVIQQTHCRTTASFVPRCPVLVGSIILGWDY